jgi:hypothetical protein
MGLGILTVRKVCRQAVRTGIGGKQAEHAGTGGRLAVHIRPCWALGMVVGREP